MLWSFFVTVSVSPVKTSILVLFIYFVSLLFFLFFFRISFSTKRVSYTLCLLAWERKTEREKQERREVDLLVWRKKKRVSSSTVSSISFFFLTNRQRDFEGRKQGNFMMTVVSKWGTKKNCSFRHRSKSLSINLESSLPSKEKQHLISRQGLSSRRTCFNSSLISQERERPDSRSSNSLNKW